MCLRTSIRVFCAVLLAVSASCAWSGARDFLGALDLRTDPRIIVASVEEVGRGVEPNTYFVRYTFDLEGDKTLYSAHEGWRSERFCQVSPEVFDRANTEGKVEVIYLERDPWINRPISGRFDLAGDFSRFLVGTLLAFASAIVGVLPRRGRLGLKAVAARLTASAPL
jgi:hypothetical protein